MLPWLQSMLSDVECCTMRGRPQSARGQALGAPPPLVRTRTPERKRFGNWHPDGHLSDEFFVRMADLCANDHEIAHRIDDDRTSPIIWGEARSLRVYFLQKCIQDKYDQCRRIWEKLSEFERRDFMHVYHHGPPSREYFLDIMLHDEQAWRDISDCGSSKSGRSDTTYQSASSYTSV